MRCYMKVNVYRNLNTTERYITSKKLLTTMLEPFNTHNIHISFGLTREFCLDERCKQKPTITGKVVLEATCSRNKDISISLFPISSQNLSVDAIKGFVTTALPTLCKWIEEQAQKPDTAVIGYEQIIVEWSGNDYSFHQVGFL